MERLEQVNLYSLEEAQGETRPESINTRSNRNQGRKLFRRREDKEQCLKQRQEEFMLGLARKEDGIRHLAEMGVLLLRTPAPLWKLHKAVFSLSSAARLRFPAAPPRFFPASRFTRASCTEPPQHALEGLIKQIEMHLGLWLDN